MRIGYQAPDTTIWQGNVMDTPWPIESGSVQVVCTSPPYWQLRDYNVPPSDWPEVTYHLVPFLPPVVIPPMTCALGLEPTPEAFVGHLVLVFREVWRVLRDDGCMLLNIGDSYAGSGKGPSNSLQRPASCLNDAQLRAGAAPTAWVPLNSGSRGVKMGSVHGDSGHTSGVTPPKGLKQKDLVGVPWLLSLALRSEGWYWRSIVVWHKLSCMPESVDDRPTNAWEPIFLLAKSERYFWDAHAVRQPMRRGSAGSTFTDGKTGVNGQGRASQAERHDNPAGANLRNVLSLSPEPLRDGHYASYPTAIPRLAVLAGSSEAGCCSICGAPHERVVERERTFESGSGKAGHLPNGKNGADLQGGGVTLDVRRGPCVHTSTTGWRPTCSHADAPTRPCLVLDPFMGSGTTALVARQLGRHSVGLELNPEYIAIIERRMGKQTPSLFALTAPAPSP